VSVAFAVFFWATLVIYALTVGAQIFGVTFFKEKWATRAIWGLIAGLVVHTVLVGWRWVETGHIPTIGHFENALVGSWFIVVLTLWASMRKYPLVAAGALPFALLILAVGGVGDASPSPLVASLQSFWLYIHIFFAWLAYGGYTVACGTGIVYLVKTRGGRALPKESDTKLNELMFRSIAFGFITDAIMIAAGSIWAKNLWGSYWSWDPVETWSLLSWLIYGLALHLRVTMGWRGRKLAWVLVIAIVTVLISFWGVNLVMETTDHLFNT